MADIRIRALTAAEARSKAFPVVEQSENENNSRLISKVLSELNSQLGLDDFELAKFVADLGRNCDTTDEFDERLKELGIQVPNYFVCSLFNKIHEGECEDVDLGSIEENENERREKLRLLIQDRRQKLPIYNVKSDLMKDVRHNGVLVVTGEIGSGKTTQITQYLVEAGFAGGGCRIGCTQPRHELVGSVAERVAEEYGCELGQQVGYATTFEDCTSETTLIKYMTCDVLLREFMVDRNLSQYTVIVLDEADARTVYTDVLIGMLKQLVKRRPHDFRLVVIISALAYSNAKKFSEYFFDCNAFTISGSTYPVKIVYLDEPPLHPLPPALEAIGKIMVEETEGDILLFWPYDDEIDLVTHYVCDLVKNHQGQIPLDLLILPVNKDFESSVFKPAPPGRRKLVIAGSSFPEVCMSIDGICYVLDPGVASQAGFDPDRGLDLYVQKPISKASAMLRASLAGRVDKGTCLRLFTEEFYHHEMPRLTYLEIQRLNLGSMALIMKSVGIHDLFAFDFMDPPPPQALTSAMEQLYRLGALDKEGHLTQLGRLMAAFPLDPPLSRMLIAGVNLGCSDEILTIISMIETEAAYYSFIHVDEVRKIRGKRAKFVHPGGDFMTMLAIFEDGKVNGFSEQWCVENFIRPPLIQRAQVARKELIRIMLKCNLEVVSAGGNEWKIRKAIASGFFFNAAKKDEKEGYRRLVDNQRVVVCTYSVFHGRYPQPEWVVCHWLCARRINGITAVEPQWLGIGTSDEGLGPKYGMVQTNFMAFRLCSC